MKKMMKKEEKTQILNPINILTNLSPNQLIHYIRVNLNMKEEAKLSLNLEANITIRDKI